MTRCPSCLGRCYDAGQHEAYSVYVPCETCGGDGEVPSTDAADSAADERHTDRETMRGLR